MSTYEETIFEYIKAHPRCAPIDCLLAFDAPSFIPDVYLAIDRLIEAGHVVKNDNNMVKALSVVEMDND